MATKRIEAEAKKTSNELKNEEILKEVRIPINPINPDDKEVIVGVNEKYAKIIRGETTKVSIPVYEQLVNAGLV